MDGVDGSGKEINHEGKERRIYQIRASMINGTGFVDNEHLLLELFILGTQVSECSPSAACRALGTVVWYSSVPSRALEALTVLSSLGVRNPGHVGAAIRTAAQSHRDEAVKNTSNKLLSQMAHAVLKDPAAYEQFQSQARRWLQSTLEPKRSV